MNWPGNAAGKSDHRAETPLGINWVFQKYALAPCIKACLELQGFPVGAPSLPFNLKRPGPKGDRRSAEISRSTEGVKNSEFSPHPTLSRQGRGKHTAIQEEIPSPRRGRARVGVEMRFFHTFPVKRGSVCISLHLLFEQGTCRNPPVPPFEKGGRRGI